MSSKAGDWNCPACGDHQFARNVKCRQCLGFVTGAWDKPIRFMGVNVRHKVGDQSERFDQLSDTQQASFKRWLAEKAPLHVKHSHFPDDDAEYGYWQMCYCDELRVH